MVWIDAFPKTPTLGLVPLSCSLLHVAPPQISGRGVQRAKVCTCHRGWLTPGPRPGERLDLTVPAGIPAPRLLQFLQDLLWLHGAGRVPSPCSSRLCRLLSPPPTLKIRDRFCIVTSPVFCVVGGLCFSYSLILILVEFGKEKNHPCVKSDGFSRKP